MRKMILIINSNSKLHLSSIPKSRNLKRIPTKIYIETILKLPLLKIKKIKKKKKIYKSLQLPRRPGITEVEHSALDASIYRLPNVGLHFISRVVDPQNSGPNWSLCHDIESFVVIEFSVFCWPLSSHAIFCRDLCSELFLEFCRHRL